MRRRLLLLFAAFTAMFVLAVATLPFWLGAAARWAGPSRGLTFASYERVGYARFALRDAVFHRYGVRVTVSRVETETPLVWGWHRITQHPAVVAVENWSVEVEPNPAPKKTTTDRGWVPLRALLQKIATQLERWLPRASTGTGGVRWPGGEISLVAAKWAGRELTVDGLAYRALKANATLVFAADADAMRLAAQLVDGTAATSLESRGAEVSGRFTLWDQPAALRAMFAPRGWLPAEASLQAGAWSIPAERLKLGQLYASVRGSAQIEWRAERFAADIKASGEPLPGKSAPPLEVLLRGNGDTQAFTIESLQAALPGVTARLDEAVTVERTGKLRESAARFTLQADLAKQPWFSAKGTVTGEARLVSGLAASPVVEFSLAARGVSARDIALSAVDARGRLDWPRIEIAAGSLVGAGGERLEGHGGWDFRAKEILDAAIDGQIRRQSVARWLPKQPEFDVIKLSARAAGALAEVQHSGRAQADGVKAPGLNPAAVSVEWRGRGATIEQFTASAQAGASNLALAGTADTTALQLTSLDFTQADAARLRLVAPATVRWRPQLQVESLQLAGPEGTLNLSATVGETGRIQIAGSEISSRWFTDFVATPGPAWKLTLLALAGAWDRGPMTFTLTGGASLEIAEGRTAAVNVAARGDKEGVQIEALRATEGEATVVNATGRAPVTFTPGASPLLHIDTNGALLVDATVAPNAEFWQKLADISGVELKEPQASAHLTGTWQRPVGNANLKAARIAISAKRVSRPLPAIESLEVQLTGDRGGVVLETFTVKVEGQVVRAQGKLPVPDGQWDELFKQPLAAAQRGADLHLEVPDAEVAVFTRFLPAVLAPQGRLQADLHYKGGGLEGFLKLRGAASRPLGPLGVLQEISADIALAGRTLTLRGVTAKSGGQPVTLTGTVEMPESGGPRFDLALRGDNLPFVRQTGLLLRGDLDLKLQTPTGAPPRLSGTVRLRDSLFLTDVRAFLPKGGGVSAARRPPYFSIETPPVNAWSLAVDVVGEQFLRLRTPVFAGVASARFRLGGTLGEPRAIGEIAIDEGNVRMPFANFEVKQSSVRLTEADPFVPEIYLRGTGRRYGYDLTMEINGNASQPNVVFSSSPALDTDQVLLMVMTGAAPTNAISQSGTQRVASIGYFLGQSLLGSLGSEAADADRLSIASGEKVSRQGKETYAIEYKLSERWTLTGEYNEFDEYNAGVKWRIFRAKRASEGPGNDAKK